MKRATLSSEQIAVAIKRFQKIIESLNSFDPDTVNDRTNPSILKLTSQMSTAIEKAFPRDSSQYLKYINYSKIDRAGYHINGTSIQQVRRGLHEGKELAIATLELAIEDLTDDLELQGASTHSNPLLSEGHSKAASDKVFLVHGHDNGAKFEVARFLEKAKLSPIILHEQPNRGMTIIEKLEAHSDVAFVVVLLTPDDLAKAVSEESFKHRARQNVVAELFYFSGKLGRKLVFPLVKGDLELPSDIAGVVYTTMDDAGGWKASLLREMKEAGIKTDWQVALS